MRKNYFFLFLFCFLLSFGFLYFIVVNTVFKNKTLYNIYLAEENISFKNKNELNEIISNKIINNIPENIVIKYSEKVEQIPKTEIFDDYSF